MEQQAFDLDKKQILVVEDDFVLAREICNELRAHGASIIGPAPTVHYARLIMGTRKIDGAVLDIKLFGEDVYGLADDLMRDGVPMLFATAYLTAQVAEKFRWVDTLHKPIDLEMLVERVSAFRRRKVMPAPLTVTSIDRTGLPRPIGTDTVYDRFSRALSRVMRDPH